MGMPQTRRAILGVFGSVLVAGCLGFGDDATVSETVQDTYTKRFEAESGDELRVELSNDEGLSAAAFVTDPNGDTVLEVFAETSAENTTTVETGGTYTLTVSPDDVASVSLHLD